MKTITIEATYHDDQFSSEAPEGFMLTETRTERRKEPFMWGKDGQPSGWNNIVNVWHTYTSEAPASTANPTESDIAERVRLLRETAEAYAPIEAKNPNSGQTVYRHFASCQGRFYLEFDAEKSTDLVGTPNHSYTLPEFVEVTEMEFYAELRRVAIRQLLAERGAK